MSDQDLLTSVFGDMSPEEALLEIDRADCEQSFGQFFQGAWPYIDSARLRWGAALDGMAEHLEAVKDGEIKRLIINVPPRFLKSSMTSVAFPAWVWAQSKRSPTSGPGVSIISGSYALNLAIRDATKCRRLIQSQWYQERWSDRVQLTGDQNAKQRFDNTQRGTRFATSVGSQLTGEGGNIIIIDDPNAANEAFSEATIEATIEWWDGTLPTRFNDPDHGAFIVIQQRLAENDLTGHILSKDHGEYTHLMLPMRYEPERAYMIYPNKIGWSDWRSEEGELLAPDRFGESAVKNLEIALGPYGAAGQLQQRPEVKGGGIIKREWWNLWGHDKYPAFDYIAAFLDTAYTTKTQNDPSAMTIWGIFSEDPTAQTTNAFGKNEFGAQRVQVTRSYKKPHPKAMLIYAWEERLELNDLVERCATEAKRWKIDNLVIESKAAGQSVAQELRRLYQDSNFGVQLYDPGTQDKMARLYSVQHLFADNLVFAPDKGWAEKVITQVAAFPKAKHDDLVDTVSMAMTHFRHNGLLTMVDEDVRNHEYEISRPGAPPPPLYAV